ncbi:MAG: recombination regulator RecX [Cyanobacteria bacterium]|nr:recombination regulator RecX [Cyanobacteriota bacterium]
MADAYTVALTLLSAREWSEAQLRTRLKRRQLDADDIDAAVEKLKADGTLNDRRVAMAVGRMESAIKGRGRARAIQKIRQAGIDSDTADDAVREVFQDIDEEALLDQAIERKLRGKTSKELDDKGKARIVRALAGQGFRVDAILRRLKLPPSR